jgi:hypothetical protein
MPQASDGKVAGVAVFLEAGSANAAIQQLWQCMPNAPGKELEVVVVELNPDGLLPGLGHAGAAAKSLKLPARITIKALEQLAVQEAPWPSVQFPSPA